MGRGKGKRHFVPRPPRNRKTPGSSAAERFEYARRIWREDMEENGKITVSVNGANGMQARMMEIFGCSARDAQLLKIRSEVVAEHREFEQRRRAETVTLKTRPLAKVLELKKEEIVSDDRPTGPGTGHSIKDASVRLQWVTDYLRRHPEAHNDEVSAACKEHFGMGVGYGKIGNARRLLGVGIIKTRAGEGERVKKDEPAQAPTPIDAAEVVKAAVRLLLDECPDLEWLELKIVDGEPTVNYRVAVRRVVEGEVKL